MHQSGFYEILLSRFIILERHSKSRENIIAVANHSYCRHMNELRETGSNGKWATLPSLLEKVSSCPKWGHQVHLFLCLVPFYAIYTKGLWKKNLKKSKRDAIHEM
ncbi:hypothetical protein RMCBS344292_14394 [Rhizopus microsporus]|nr:hypothetical protein RMCBS344292_14394 [Rhizopus microsporus]